MEPGYTAPRHSHDVGHEVFLILSGRAEFEIDGERAVLGPGQMCFARAGQMHQVKVLGDQPMTMYLSVTPHLEPTHTFWDDQGQQAAPPLRRPHRRRARPGAAGLRAAGRSRGPPRRRRPRPGRRRGRQRRRPGSRRRRRQAGPRRRRCRRRQVRPRGHVAGDLPNLRDPPVARVRVERADRPGVGVLSARRPGAQGTALPAAGRDQAVQAVVHEVRHHTLGAGGRCREVATTTWSALPPMKAVMLFHEAR